MLPNDIWITILSLIFNPIHILRLRLVCKQFYTAIQSESLWQLKCNQMGFTDKPLGRTWRDFYFPQVIIIDTQNEWSKGPEYIYNTYQVVEGDIVIYKYHNRLQWCFLALSNQYAPTTRLDPFEICKTNQKLYMINGRIGKKLTERCYYQFFRFLYENYIWQGIDVKIQSTMNESFGGMDIVTIKSSNKKLYIKTIHSQTAGAIGFVFPSEPVVQY